MNKFDTGKAIDHILTKICHGFTDNGWWFAKDDDHSRENITVPYWNGKDIPISMAKGIHYCKFFYDIERFTWRFEYGFDFKIRLASNEEIVDGVFTKNIKEGLFSDTEKISKSIDEINQSVHNEPDDLDYFDEPGNYPYGSDDGETVPYARVDLEREY